MVVFAVLLVVVVVVFVVVVVVVVVVDYDHHHSPTSVDFLLQVEGGEKVCRGTEGEENSPVAQAKLATQNLTLTETTRQKVFESAG